MTDVLAPGATIGILGGGQLGRMLAVAAARLGYRVHIYDPDQGAPGAEVARVATHASYGDEQALRAFAQSVQVVTYEFENIPPAALDLIEAVVPIRPNRKALATSRDRLDEKTFLHELGLRTARFAAVDDAEDLAQALTVIGTPSILKTRTMGYDGKGQARILSPEGAEAAFAQIGGRAAILEGFVDFDREVSVIAARGLDGSVAAYDPGENVHEGGILRTTTVPARLSPGMRSDAVLAAARILNALGYVGVLGVEFFVTPRGLLVNEIAPRVHNSGHWTEAGCLIDQFEQHIRAIAGLPLGDGKRHADVVMENLIGHDMDRLPDLLADGAQIHLYGKAETREGRKMGHVNRIRR
ncbi:5-(carboxyamino)imidazole ribonucleotide synthase [Rubellimicrobium rubrum]|uniref:N5-carboxyaminoimidazole ribonucleotide synthase n=1 Tax=Rubellimicrobium rubrum TaxID=2585369 RepID=A0A5C4MWZ2_9RHOB|nr:5-(carboxyamino)imidazole ribonucleotide synthase [Rubellimicrobium rubrum]TNC50128.1 5-(carboxyamino)imidazole ribonucleotide synthase [Rubellimicrobium rubrum]